MKAISFKVEAGCCPPEPNTIEGIRRVLWVEQGLYVWTSPVTLSTTCVGTEKELVAK
jgi:hypothetical protein